MPTSRFTNLRSAIRNRVLSLVTRERQDLQESVEFVVGETKLGIGSLRSIHSLRASKLTDLKKLLGPSTFFSAIPDLVIQRRNISLIARIFSVPSVSGPSFQVCSYHVDLALLGPMSACNSKCILGQYRPSKDTISKHGKHSNSKNMISLNRFGKTSMGLNGRCGSENSAIHGYLMYDVAKRCSNLYPHSGWGIRFLHGPLSSCLSAGAATDVSCESSAHDEQIKSWGEASQSQVSAENPLKLLSGSCYLPHPDKEETGGEDAHFICKDEQAVGVADGVGGWADLGVDSGYYSRELMSNSVKSIQEEPKGCIDPARVLEKAHSCTTAKGSSTACIIALTDKGLHAVNLGDSGFIVIRNGSTVFRSPVQQHNFNFTYQLESGNNGDLPSSGQVFTVAVLPGDIIIAGTDGLFDNLYNNEITAVVVQTKRAGLGPEVTAQKIAALARQRAVDKNRQTPFSTAAQDAGFRYYGGKLDDITVVVSYVTGSN